MVNPPLKWLLTALTLLLSQTLWANSVTVQTDRQQVEMGDIVTLTIDADFQSRLGQPDLSALQDQFELLGSQRSSNIQIVNGDFQTSTRWLVQLLPKQAGELMIPPIDIDGVKS
ncbi:MAG: BatD family protein, partial [Thiotrichales bacterium]|nr:BatD family protein [Thiotrichales bacterium]